MSSAASAAEPKLKKARVAQVSASRASSQRDARASFAGTRADSFLDIEESTHTGPKDMEELYCSNCTPLRYLQRMLDERKEGFETLLENYPRVCFYSHFSGCNTDYVALHHIGVGLRRLGHSMPVPEHVHACDISRGALTVLKEMTPGPRHVFRDMHARLPASVRDAVATVWHRPVGAAAGDPDLPERFEGVDCIHRRYFLQEFDVHSTAYCVKHDAQCAVYPQADSLAPGSIVLASAGVICKDWSSYGSRRGLAGESGREFSCWKWEAATLSHPLLVIECSPNLTLECISQGLEQYQWQSVVLQPQWFGVPVARERRFSIGVLQGFALTPPLPQAFPLMCLKLDSEYVPLGVGEVVPMICVFSLESPSLLVRHFERWSLICSEVPSCPSACNGPRKAYSKSQGSFQGGRKGPIIPL